MYSVSVAMAAYNGEMFISEQIDSIISQLGNNDELIISYDKSSDNTWEIISAYQQKDARIMILINEDPGVIGNFNNAILHCSREVIFISDQDDVWAKCKISRILKEFEHSEADLIIHNGYHTDESLKPIGSSFFDGSRMGAGIIRNIIKSRYSGCCMAFTNKMKSVILPIPPDIDAYDRWIASICEIKGRVAYLSDVLIYHRLHDNNFTPKKKRSLIVMIKARLNLIKHLIIRLSRVRKDKK